MEGPGLSIFQGSENFELNNSQGNREEEEEFLAEENKRKAELKHLFQNAFDDLIDDDEEDGSSACSSSQYSHGNQRFETMKSSVNNSDDEYDRTNEMSMPHHYGQMYDTGGRFPVRQTTNSHNVKPIPQTHTRMENNIQYVDQYDQSNGILANPRNTDSELETYKQSDLNSMTQLQVLYDVQKREIERLKIELAAETNNKEQILKKLVNTETEKNGIIETLNQNNQLLVQSKNEITSLQKQVVTLTEEIKLVEKSRNEIQTELDMAKLQISNLEQNMAIMERCDSRGNREKQIDGIIESMNAKHRKEVNELQSELNDALQKIKDKEDSYKFLENKLEELEKRHMNTLLNKCDSTVKQEAAVKAVLDEANAENIQLRKQYHSLQVEYKALKEDLERYEAIRSFNLLGTSSDDQETDSIIMMDLGRKSEGKCKSNSFNTSDTISKLKVELHRALIGQRTKRQEIKKLQQQVQSKELQIGQMREQEKVYLTKIDNLKRDVAIVMEKLTKLNQDSSESKHLEELSELQQELDKVEKAKKILEDRVINLEDQVKHLENKLLEEEDSKGKQSDEFLRFHDREVEKMKKEWEQKEAHQQQEWKNRIEELLNENTEVKQLYIELRSQKDQLVRQLQEQNLNNSTLKKENNELSKQIETLKEDISKLEDHIIHLNEERKSLEEQMRANISEANNSSMNALRDELEMLRKEVGDSKSEKISEGADYLKAEIKLIKQKYKEFETRYKSSFDATLNRLKSENSKLAEQLKEKEEELKQTQISASTKTQFADMEEIILSEKLNIKRMEELDRLEKEVERLKTLETAKNDELLQLKNNFQKTLEQELEELEIKLNNKHSKELMAVEDRIKSLTVQYFKDEMEKLRTFHKEELERLRNSHKEEVLSIRRQETNKFEEMKKTISQKEAEIIQAIELKKEINHLQSVIQENKTKTAMMVTHWAKEVNEIKEKHDATLKEVEELRHKLKSARKAALSYKRKLQEVKAAYPEKYNNLLRQVKERFESTVATKEQEIMKKLEEIEKEYKRKEEALLKMNPIKVN